MDKKSWPWKKKLSDRMSSSPEPADLSQLSASKQAEEQPKASAAPCGITPPSDEASSQQADSNLKTSSNQISVAMADVDAKDDLVKQHMKIAEEAVAGWEKAETEAADLKEKLEVALQQKLATEDRVSHLDGALKECMKQLRHVREDQEQKIHETVIKKTREWEKVRTDLEARLDDATNELCEALAENQAMSKSLQERAKTIAEICDTKARLEADTNVLQARLASLEKENARFNYELHVMSKELEVRNEEREYSKRAGEAASKHSLESSRKIAKLEEECQRLRLLVKKRHPSPASMSHMKGEADMLANDKSKRRSPCRRSTTSLPLKASEISAAEFGLDDGLREDNKLLSDRLLAMQDEAKSLRELLAKKDNELQSARLMCARTASKLSMVEEQLETHSCSCCSTKSATVAMLSRQANGVSIEPSIASKSEESGAEDVCAESWATALIAELAQFKKDNKNPVSDRVQNSLSFDLMDDFAEMEKLASLSSPDDGSKQVKLDTSQELGKDTVENMVNCEGKLEDTGGEWSNAHEFESVDRLCRKLKDKLADAEDQLNALQAKLSASDATINQLQKLLALKFEVEAEGLILSKAVEAARLAIENAGTEHPTNLGGECSKKFAESEGEKQNIWPSCYISQVDSSPQGVPDTEFCSVGADLAAAVRKVLDIVEGIGQTDYSFPYSQWISGPALENDEGHEFASPGKQWRSSGLDACVESLINLCNSLVQGKVDIIDFIAEVASALDWLVGLIFTLPDKSPSTNCSQRHSQNCKEQVDSSDSELTSAGSSPTQVLCNASDMEEAKATESQDVLPDQSSISNLSFQFSESSTHEEDLSKITSEKAALKVSLEAEIRKANRYESEILRLKLVNDQLEHNHELTLEKLADLDSQVCEANQILQKLTNELLESENRSADLQSQLREILDQKQSLEDIVADLEYAKGALESELDNARENVETVERKLLGLEEELSEEIRCRKEVEMRFLELKQEQEQHRGESTHDLANSGSSADEATRLKKEQEIAAAAEKLAECQQTILNLGKQLKALGVSKDVCDASFTSPVETPVLSQKMSSATTTRRLCSGSDQVHSSVSDVRDEMQYNDEPRATSALRSERERKQEQGGVIKPLRNSHHSGSSQEGDPGTPAARRGGQANGRYGRQAQPLDLYTNNNRGCNRFPSPTHEENQDGVPGFITSSITSVEPVVSSPLRSPARFLSLRTKNVNAHEPSKHADNEPAEKHGSSGFSRFFARTKGGH